MNNILSVPIYEKDQYGHIIPNLLFHRTCDRIHSRCVEYPFAAAHVGGAKTLLDVGSAKADKFWISWLDSLDIDVYATDYDEFIYPAHKIKFHKSDVRKLAFEDNTFDKIIAVSVIEHIGLEKPQVVNEIKPETKEDGDLQAFKELLRVLKTGGEIIMTFPFGLRDGLILGDEARNYTEQSIKKFSSNAEPVLLEYYEYQYVNGQKIFRENNNYLSRIKSGFMSILKEKINEPVISGSIGPVTWRCIAMNKTKAKHDNHTEGVLCGIWRKTNNT